SPAQRGIYKRQKSRRDRDQHGPEQRDSELPAHAAGGRVGGNLRPRRRASDGGTAADGGRTRREGYLVPGLEIGAADGGAPRGEASPGARILPCRQPRTLAGGAIAYPEQGLA